MNRSGYIKIREHCSSEFAIAKGVPQGSVLGPALFCIYISGIKSTTPNVLTVKYADDINLVIPLSSPNPQFIKAEIDNETDNIHESCKLNGLIVNVEKSKVLIVARHNVSFDIPPKLPCVEAIKILGLHLNNKLNWNTHVEYIRKKASQRLHIIRRLKPLLPKHELHLVYVCLIRSLLEYASPVFVGLNKKLQDLLVKIDKRAHRMMSNCPFPYDLSICDCSDQTLLERRILASVRLFRSIERNANNLLRPCLPVTLPNSRHYRMPHVSCDKYLRSFFPFMILSINSEL